MRLGYCPKALCVPPEPAGRPPEGLTGGPRVSQGPALLVFCHQHVPGAVLCSTGHSGDADMSRRVALERASAQGPGFWRELPDSIMAPEELLKEL